MKYSLQGELRGEGGFEFSEGPDPQISYCILPHAAFFDRRYGHVAITPEKTKMMADNFDKGYPQGYRPPVKFGHGGDAPSPGVISNAQSRGDGLWITFSLDDEALESVKKGRFRHMSAEFVDEYMDKATGQEVGAVLVGAALTNAPAHPRAGAFRFSDEEGAWRYLDDQEDASAPQASQEGVMNSMDVKKFEELQARIEELERVSKDKDKALSDVTAEAQAQAEKVRLLSDEAAQLRSAVDARTMAIEALKREQRRGEIRAFSEEWKGKGIPPVVMDRLVAFVELNDMAEVKALSDDGGTVSVDVLKALSDVFAVFPKVPMGAQGKQPSTQKLSEDEDALVAGIVALANGTSGK